MNTVAAVITPFLLGQHSLPLPVTSARIRVVRPWGTEGLTA
jgi:hypothetical protein